MPASHVHLRLEPTRVVRVRQTAFSRRRSGQLLAEMKGGLGLVYAEVLTDSRRSDDVVTLKHLQVDIACILTCPQMHVALFKCLNVAKL